MALKATIFKIKLSISNFNIHHYEDYSLTVARHPSEHNLRMLARLIAFSLNAQEENLAFTKGLSSDAEPDIWRINHDGSIEHWIELGHLDEKRIRQVASRANKVSLYTYQGNQSLQWFENNAHGLSRFSNINVIHLILPAEEIIDTLIERGMSISCSIEDSEIWLSNDKEERFMIEFKNQKTSRK